MRLLLVMLDGLEPGLVAMVALAIALALALLFAASP
jgi:hypothetical protein